MRAGMPRVITARFGTSRLLILYTNNENAVLTNQYTQWSQVVRTQLLL